jgi:hypothetical protein
MSAVATEPLDLAGPVWGSVRGGGGDEREAFVRGDAPMCGRIGRAAVRGSVACADALAPAVAAPVDEAVDAVPPNRSAMVARSGIAPVPCGGGDDDECAKARAAPAKERMQALQ